MKRMRTVFRRIFGALLALALVAAGAFAVMSIWREGESSEPQAPASQRIPKVSTITLRPRAWAEQFRTFGVVRPVEEVEIATDFPATVRAVRFDEGQRVKAGQVLIEFNAEERRLRLEQANAVVERVKVLLTKARNDMTRATDLRKQGAVSVSELDLAETEFRAAEAQLAEAMAARGLAQRDLEETTLVSAVSGLVAKRAVEPGERVMPGEPLGSIQVVETVRVVTYVSERDVNALRVGGEAIITSAGVAGRQYRARIESIGSTADAQTANFPVKLTVENEDGLLRDGMTARVHLEGIPMEDALLVPSRALVDRKRRRVLYKVEDGAAAEVDPVLDMTSGDHYLVLDGLSAGDQIIIDGQASVVDGSRVEIIR